MHDVPALLIQLQDDLSRSRQREAFWISVVVHLAIIILAVNSTRFANLLHKHAVVIVSPEDLAKQKDLTYLELPPDEQKLTQRPKTNIISDKDRVAQSKAPQLDRKELKKILDSARPGQARDRSASHSPRPLPHPPRNRIRSAAGTAGTAAAASAIRRLACRRRPRVRPKPNFSSGDVAGIGD